MKSHRVLSHRVLVDIQYQSVNKCYQFILIGIDFDRLTNSLIAYARTCAVLGQEHCYTGVL